MSSEIKNIPPVAIEKPKFKVWNGARAIAEAVKVADVDVISAYPIRPYTGIMNALASMIANGEFIADVVIADSEHSQFEIVKHASAVGARTFVGSSGVGLAYAAEAIIVTALSQLPVVGAIGTRALDDPGNFGMEWSDVLMFRDYGWLISWAKTVQEAHDMTLVAYRVAEDKRVLLPHFVVLDGAALTHVATPIVPVTKEQATDFLPPYKPPYRIDPIDGPVTKAQHIAPSLIGPEQRKLVDVATKRAKEVIVEAWKDFATYTGREYPPFIEAIGMEDADFALIGMGAYMKDIEIVAKRMREKGVKIGTIRLRYVRPFPAEDLLRVIDGVKAAGVIEFGYSFGSPFGTGSLYHEIATSLYETNTRPELLDFLFLGGREPKVEHFMKAAEMIIESVHKKPQKKAYWLTLRGEDI
ncbi:2-oxoacid:ferredoxin oxidoreductase subunit alpha [Fervidicoccus fontis]|uniref:2-oxoacid oxidoreductase (ferredoxin) n=1 Tax=Fervidicoccus fontis (strain DSM 19380 / JCM 18336 / VKM B-2539 / Kam940) TaxID=1163730 RepID=I0A1R4_FERFK|nr:2-oxoacid:ferredoxin oxidoreductase subunit alpha [Fervidicoccus fontis]AFH42921.1 2-oxoacid:ferredoxin oxidoreductase, alpha subunit [Fervidicoccus fontis Kam940]